MKGLLVVCTLVCFLSSSSAQDTEKIDSLKKELAMGRDSIKYHILFDLCVQYLRSNNDSALHYSDLSLKAALELGDSVLIAKSFHARGRIKGESGDINVGINEMEIALGIARRNRIDDRVKYVLNSLAIANTRIGDYDVALDYNFQSLKIREEEGDKESISISLNNIGLVYLEIRDYENALEYFIRSYDLKIEIGNLDEIEIRLTNIGFCYSGLEKYDKAIESFLKSFELCNNNCEKDVLMIVHDALGKGYHKLGKLSDAIKQYESSIKLANQIGIPRYECIGYRSLSEINLEQHKLEEAINFLDQAQQIAEKTDLKIEILENSYTYAKIYSELGDFEKSTKYQQKYIDLNKRIYSGELIQKISRITSDYAERENLKTIASKDQVLSLQQEVIARQKSQYAFIITITFLVMGLAFVMYRSNQTQQKANQALAIAKETIQNQNVLLQKANHKLESQVENRTKELFESNESLTKANEEMDNFIYKTSHDIRGPLASLKGICNVAMLDVKDPVAMDYLQKLDSSAAKLNSTLSRLLIINQINHSSLSPEFIDLNDEINSILAYEQRKGIPERIEIDAEVEPDLKFRSDKAMIRIILENLIDNSIKFHNESDRVTPFVKIKAFTEKDSILIKVIDNGIGISEVSKERIFQLFVRASERSDSGGIGLYLSKLATNKLEGAISYATNSEGYTEFTVQFPVDLVPVMEKKMMGQSKFEIGKQNTPKAS